MGGRMEREERGEHGRMTQGEREGREAADECGQSAHDRMLQRRRVDVVKKEKWRAVGGCGGDAGGDEVATVSGGVESAASRSAANNGDSKGPGARLGPAPSTAPPATFHSRASTPSSSPSQAVQLHSCHANSSWTHGVHVSVSALWMASLPLPPSHEAKSNRAQRGRHLLCLLLSPHQAR